MDHELILKNSPILYLHSLETHFPLSVDDYLDNICIFINNELHLRSPTQNELFRFSIHEQDAKNAIMKTITNKVKLGDSTLNVTAYGIIQKFQDLHIYEGHKYITYVYFYPYNSASKILGLTEAGEHLADIEHITIELDIYNTPLRYYYASHGKKEGTWYQPSEIEFENDRPVIYVARGTHASYNKPAIFPRFFGFTKDETNKGYRWEPDYQIINYPDDPNFSFNSSWFFYPGRWGDQGIRGVVKQDWFSELPMISKSRVTFQKPTWDFITFLFWLMSISMIGMSSFILADWVTKEKSRLELILFFAINFTTIYYSLKFSVSCIVKYIT